MQRDNIAACYGSDLHTPQLRNDLGVDHTTLLFEVTPLTVLLRIVAEKAGAQIAHGRSPARLLSLKARIIALRYLCEASPSNLSGLLTLEGAVNANPKATLLTATGSVVDEEDPLT